jgi:diacylglycerol kinase
MNFVRMIQSFKDAARGVIYVFWNEQNFRLQVFASLVVVLLSWYFKLSRSEWVVILLLIFLVIILELINSAVEKFADVLKPRLDLQVQTVKDIMAGVVLLASLGAVLIGLVIFYPHLIEFTGHWW